MILVCGGVEGGGWRIKECEGGVAVISRCFEEKRKVLSGCNLGGLSKC